MKLTFNPEKHAINIVIGGIAFGMWQHSILAGFAFMSLLAVVAGPEK